MTTGNSAGTGTHRIMAQSRDGMFDPSFTETLMKQVYAQERKRYRRNYILCCVFGMLAFGLILTMVLINILSNPAAVTDGPATAIKHLLADIGDLAKQYQFLISPLAAVLLVQLMIGSGRKRAVAHIR